MPPFLKNLLLILAYNNIQDKRTEKDSSWFVNSFQVVEFRGSLFPTSLSKYKNKVFQKNNNTPPVVWVYKHLSVLCEIWLQSVNSTQTPLHPKLEP